MRQLTCFVIMPSNRNGEAVKLLKDKKWGLVEYPTGCQKPVSENQLEQLNFDAVYNQIIRIAINEVNEKNKNTGIQINCLRGQDLFEAGDIISQIMRYVCTAHITITDVTANNPNVFLEFGIRLSVCDALNIMICHKNAIESLPFDVKDLRCIDYTMEIEGANKAKNQIAGFLQTYIKNQLTDDSSYSDETYNTSVSEPYSYFKRQVELHSGRLQERRLVNVLEGTPKLLADCASFILAKKKRPGLKQELFRIFDELEDILENDPQSQMRAIEHLELVSKIAGLSKEKLQDIYFKLFELCDANPKSKNKAEKYLKLYEELED